LISILIGSLIFGAGSATAQTDASGQLLSSAADGLTLSEAARIALVHNPVAASARTEVDVAEAQVRRARSSILPQIYVDGRYTRNDREVSFNFDGTDVPILPADDWSASIRLSQPVYAGGRELKAIRQARLAVGASEHAARGTEDDVLFNVSTSYLNVLGADALIAVELQNVEVASRQRGQAQVFFDVGEVTRVDVLRADSSIKGAERQLAAARELRENAASLFRLSLGADVPVVLEAPDLALPPLPSEEDLIGIASGRRPELQRAEIALEVAGLEVAKQRGAYLPLVTAEASFTQQASAFPSDQSAALTLNFSVPVFTSGEIGSRVAIAKEQEKQFALQLDRTRQIVREDIRRALVELRTAETALTLARDQRIAAEAEYEQIFELYRAQEATSLDVQSAETALAGARRAVVTETLNRNLAELQVWHTAGALKSVLLEE
jgi:outer membrane protein